MCWFELLIRRAGLRRLLGTFAAIVLQLLPGHAWASATCTGTANITTISMPAFASVPRDAVAGTLLSSWVSSPAVTNYYTCSVSGGTATGAEFQPLSLTPSGVKVSNNGVSTTVFNTNLPGVGIAIQVRTYANGCSWQPWQDLGTPGSVPGAGSPPPAPWVGTNCSANGSRTNGGQASVALVKTGSITAGTVTGGVLFQAGSFIAPTMQSGMYQSFTVTSTAVTVLSCTTPNVTVSMGSYPAATFNGSGSSSNPVGFNVAVNNCPAGMNKIQYSFDAPGGVVNVTNGVIALSSDSTATGIGLQLKDNSGNALKYDTQYTLGSYVTSTGGSYTIPLTAAYYQTGTAVTAGTANGVLTFTMTYQ